MSSNFVAVNNAIEELVYKSSMDLLGQFKEFLLEKTDISNEQLTEMISEFADKHVAPVKKTKKKVAVKKTSSSDATEDKPKRVSAYNIFLGKLMATKMKMVDAQAKWAEWKVQNPTLKTSQALLDKWLESGESSQVVATTTTVPVKKKPVADKKVKIVEQPVPVVESDSDSESDNGANSDYDNNSDNFGSGDDE
jgi:hypothetical protein